MMKVGIMKFGKFDNYDRVQIQLVSRNMLIHRVGIAIAASLRFSQNDRFYARSSVSSYFLSSDMVFVHNAP